MSVQFRQKFINELSKKSTSAYRKIVADFFDKGEIRMERKFWNITYQNAWLKLQEEEERPVIQGKKLPEISDNLWKRIANHLLKTLGGSKSKINWFTGFSHVTPDLISIQYTRKRDASGLPLKSAMALDLRAAEEIKDAMLVFFNKKVFKDHVFEVLKQKGKGKEQEYEHGATGEENFMFSSSVETKGTQAPGAQGTVLEQRLAKFISQAKYFFRREKWFSSVIVNVAAKMEDMFGYDTELFKKDGTVSVEDTVIFRGAVVPTASSYNPGAVDTKLKKEFVKFLSDPKFWREETMRLNSMIDAETADQMFADSPGPSKRIENAAIKLAAANVLDNLTKKSVRNKKKVGKQTKSTKQGRKTKSKATGKSRTSIKRKNASVSRKGNRKAQDNAIQQNPIALKELINAKLPDELLKQMQLPKLRNRTGRFRNSAQVTNVMVGPRGGTHIEYTYMKNPYQTFEPGGRQGSVNRDPRRLIGGTVREIAQELMGKRFVKVRSV